MVDARVLDRGSRPVPARPAARAPARGHPGSRIDRRSADRVRSVAAQSSTMSTASCSRGRCSCPTDSPPTATRSVRATASAEMPWSAAFSLSTTKRAPSAAELPRTRPRPPPPACSRRCVRMVPARRWRAAASGPYTSATSDCSTGGPGGTSATAIRAPWRAAIAATAGRIRSANAWLCTERVLLGRRLICTSATLEPRAQVVVAHQPVEAVGCRRPDVDLIIGDLLLLAKRGRDLPGHLRGPLQGAVLRHVEDDLQLALVVVGQHLDPHPPGRNEGHRSEEQDARSGPGTPSARRGRPTRRDMSQR